MQVGSTKDGIFRVESEAARRHPDEQPSPAPTAPVLRDQVQ